MTQVKQGAGTCDRCVKLFGTPVITPCGIRAIEEEKCCYRLPYYSGVGYCLLVLLLDSQVDQVEEDKRQIIRPYPVEQEEILIKSYDNDQSHQHFNADPGVGTALFGIIHTDPCQNCQINECNRLELPAQLHMVRHRFDVGLR